jgi:hypothetical protein
MDGRYTQDGADAVAIGSSAYALPLLEVHRVGAALYRLKVAPDGSSLTATAEGPAKLGVVTTPIESGAVDCLVVSDGKQASFDLKRDGAAGLPGGSYKLVYGLLGSAPQPPLLMQPPSADATAYTIVPGKLNRLRIGPPLGVEFSATFNDDIVSVLPSVRVVGAGGEMYKVDFSTEAGRPHVVCMNGTQKLADTAMGYG